jgi:hypothetical protein
MYQILIKFTLPDNISHPTNPIAGANILGDDGTIENQIFEFFNQVGIYEAAVQFDENLVDNLGKNMMFRTPAIWSPQLNSVVRYAWNDQDLYTPAWQEFYQTHTEKVIELEKLGCKMNEIVATETDLDVDKLIRLCRVDFDVTQFLSLMPKYVLDLSPLLAEYYNEEISYNFKANEKLKLEEMTRLLELEELEKIQRAEQLELEKIREAEQLEITNAQNRLVELENIRLTELAELEKKNNLKLN